MTDIRESPKVLEATTRWFSDCGLKEERRTQACNDDRSALLAANRLLVRPLRFREVR